jgi:hypothetical protein
MPEFAVLRARLDELHPLVTISPGDVAHGAMTPPGHMQKLYTPRPSTCFTML